MGTVTPDKLQQFTGKIGNGPGFSEFLARLTVILREKDLHSATRNVIAGIFVVIISACAGESGGISLFNARLKFSREDFFSLIG